jgi:TonB-linked SusC/RagA family outer membrane protein
MFIIKRCIVAMYVLMLCYQLQAQQQTNANSFKAKTNGQQSQNEQVVNGYIKDAATGKAIESAKISYKNLYAAITDSTGRFSMKVPDCRVSIRVDAEGFQSKEIALKGTNNVTAELFESDYESFYDDVATPFGVVPKSQLTSAANSLQTKGAWNNTFETPDAYLQGKVAGLNVIRRSGASNIGANLFIRGFNSLYATNQPLFIVDGVYYDITGSGTSLISGYYNNPLSFIDLKDIDNITVIKDGSSVYGAKAANGVILITTARARQQATKIDVAIYGGVNAAPVNIPVMNASDYRIYLAEMLQSKGIVYNEVKALPYMNDDPSNPDYYRYHYNNNWQDKVFRNSYSQNGYVKITGGDNIAKYALSIGFLRNAGNIENTNLNRYNMRFNADLNLSSHLTASANLSFIYNDQLLKDAGLSLTTNPIYAALVKAPFLPANEVADNGVESPALADKDTFRVSNPTALTETMKANDKSYRFNGSVNFNYQFNDKFSLGTTIAVLVDKFRESFFVPQVGIVSDTLSNAIAKNRSGAQVSRLFNFFNDTRLAYSQTFNRVHQLSARVGVRYTHSSSEQDNGFGYNSATDQLTGVGYGVNTLRRIGGTLGEWAWLNTYLNADYNLLGKYFLSFNIAMDGSSRFGKDAYNNSGLNIGANTYALYPSIAGAWLVSSENFMAGSKFIDLLKLRASVGVTGNDDIGNFTARKYYVSQNLLGIAGLVRGNAGNPSLMGESVTKLNGGIDISLLKERVNITVDAYRNTTGNMIVYQSAPSTSGMDYSISSSGAMKTTGWEASVNGRVINHKNFKWDVGFNIAHYESIVTKLPANSIVTDYAGGTYITQVGSAPNLFYGYKSNGVYSTQAEAAAANLVTKRADGSTVAFGGGDMRFVNNTSGDNIIDGNDRQVIGNPNPKYYGGITTNVSWKNWSLDGLLSFTQGNDIYNYGRRQLESMSGYANQTEAVINRWRIDGQVTSIPKATWGDPLGNSRFSDRWIEDGSYIRLKSVSLTYNVPMKPAFVKYASVYLTGNNLLTFTKYLGYDPEFSASTGVYGQGVDVLLEPQYRSVQLGVRIGL